MARGKALAAITAIQFVEDFDFVEGVRTTAYKVGHIVRAPSDELVAAVGARAVLYVDEEQAADPPVDDGE